MASFTLSNVPWPTGTSVSAYSAQGYSTFPAGGPPGNPVATASVSGTTLTFTGLTNHTPYFAAAQVGGVWVNRRFQPGENGPPPRIPEEIDFAEIGAGKVLAVKEDESGYEFTDDPQELSTNVAVLKEAPINVEYPEYGADGTRATYSDAAFQKAIKALPANGGEIFTPRLYKLSEQLSFEGKRSVKLRGQAPGASGLDPASQLLFTQGSASSLINSKVTTGFIMEDLEVEYTSGSLTGPLIDLEGGASPVLQRVNLVGVGVATALGINVRNCQSGRFRDCRAGGLNIVAQGKVEDSDYSNAMLFDGFVMGEGSVATACFKNAGEAWLFHNCTFESLANDKAGAYTADEGVKAHGTVFDCCWFGDASTGEGTQILWRGNGLTVRGGSLGSGELGISVPDTTSDGLNIQGVRFISLTKGIQANFGAGTQHYVIGANTYTSVSGKKVSLDNGSTDAGAGFLSH